jgi:hypothetical protein
MNQKTKTILLAVVIIAALVTITTVAALITMRAPDSPDLTVNPEATPTPTPTPAPPELSQVTLSVSTITVGQSVTLSTTVNYGTPGITVTFFNQNDVAVGAAVTDSTGKAQITITPPLVDGVATTWSFYATGSHPDV